MKEQLELHKEFREKQEKYAYYLVALCVASIGFSITQTTGQSLKWIQLPLGISVLSWGISIFCGLRYIGMIVFSVKRNSMYLDMIQGKDEIAGTDLQKIKIGIDVYREGSEKLNKASILLYNWQERLFFSGILLFIVWRVIEMANI
jgi:hypothetical protein